MLICNPQNCWCSDHRKDCCFFFFLQHWIETTSKHYLSVFWWQLQLFSRQLHGLVGAGKNWNAPEKKASPKQQEQSRSSSTYFIWELNAISLSAGPAFWREGFGERCHYKKRLQIRKSGFLPRLSSSRAKKRCHRRAPSSYAKDIHFCHHPQAREQSWSFPKGRGAASWVELSRDALPWLIYI